MRINAATALDGIGGLLLGAGGLWFTHTDHRTPCLGGAPLFHLERLGAFVQDLEVRGVGEDAFAFAAGDLAQDA